MKFPVRAECGERPANHSEHSIPAHRPCYLDADLQCLDLSGRYRHRLRRRFEIFAFNRELVFTCGKVQQAKNSFAVGLYGIHLLAAAIGSANICVLDRTPGLVMHSS